MVLVDPLSGHRLGEGSSEEERTTQQPSHSLPRLQPASTAPKLLAFTHPWNMLGFSTRPARHLDSSTSHRDRTRPRPRLRPRNETSMLRQVGPLSAENPRESDSTQCPEDTEQPSRSPGHLGTGTGIGNQLAKATRVSCAAATLSRCPRVLDNTFHPPHSVYGAGDLAILASCTTRSSKPWLDTCAPRIEDRHPALPGLPDCRISPASTLSLGRLPSPSPWKCSAHPFVCSLSALVP